MRFVCIAAFISGLAATSAWAGPLTEARIARIINDVSVVNQGQNGRPASLNEVVKDEMAVKTGIKSRSELLFQDETLTRLGPESLFTFKTGTRDMSLERGTMLLQVPKGLGGAKIHTAAVTASITGTTIMLEHLPGKTLKVLVLEGSLRLSVNGKFGDSLLLLPGKMVIMSPSAKRIPDPISVNLSKVVKTSALVNMGGTSKPLPSAGLIEAEIQTQTKDLATQELVATNLGIVGNGSKVNVMADDVTKAMDTHHSVAVSHAPTPESTPLPSNGGEEPTSGSTPAGPESTPAATPAATPVSSPGSGGSPTPTPAAEATDAVTVANVGSADQPVKDQKIDKPIDLSGNGKHGELNVVSNGRIEVTKSVKVSSNAASGGSNAGGNITLESRKKKDDAIVITDSGELLSLLNAAAPGPGGTIRFTSAGGKIRVDRSTITADRGAIDIRNTGESGVIALNKAEMHGDTIKAQTLGANGELNIGGGVLDADTAIDLYATGSNGKVNFTDNTTLSGNSVKRIAGDSVTVKDGKTVTVNGPAPANVFTNRPNYTGSGGNGSTTGTFGGKGATTQPLAALPGGH